jgi:protein-L-isoaspartate(D-aspartate) O-methyltransferase
MDETELAIIRRAYAKQIMAVSGVTHRRVEDAFASIRREDFLGPGPWQRAGWRPDKYITTPDADPVYLYTNDLFGLIPERGLNNGQPSLHALLIAAADPKEGEHAIHIGAGVGYYTAIIAQLVGPTGRVTAVEVDPSLAERARNNFGGWSNVHVVCRDGTTMPFDRADVIYVNAGVTRPADIWLDNLADGGRLLLPLSSNEAFDASKIADGRLLGAVFLITRRGADFQARMVGPVRIIPCEGMRDDASERVLAAALNKGGADRATRLYRHNQILEDKCWLSAPGWCLAYE